MPTPPRCPETQPAGRCGAGHRSGRRGREDPAGSVPTDDHQRLDQAEWHPEPIEAEVVDTVEDLVGLELDGSYSPPVDERNCCPTNVRLINVAHVKIYNRGSDRLIKVAPCEV